MKNVMKKVIFAIFLIAPALTLAQKPDPAGYTIAVHVRSSRLVEICSTVTGGSNICGWQQQLSVTIGGKKYELQSGAFVKALLRVGDYKAKISEDKSQRAYENARTYEFLFPDGLTRKYFLVGEKE